jgi:hypothetical protein
MGWLHTVRTRVYDGTRALSKLGTSHETTTTNPDPRKKWLYDFEESYIYVNFLWNYPYSETLRRSRNRERWSIVHVLSKNNLKLKKPTAFPTFTIPFEKKKWIFQAKKFLRYARIEEKTKMIGLTTTSTTPLTAERAPRTILRWTCLPLDTTLNAREHKSLPRTPDLDSLPRWRWFTLMRCIRRWTYEREYTESPNLTVHSVARIWTKRNETRWFIVAYSR